MLARTAASYERDRSRQQDLLQEIGIALWRSLPRWRGEGTLKGYVARIAHNCCVDHVARETTRIEVELDEGIVDQGNEPGAAAQMHQAQRSLLRAVRNLPLGQRSVVMLSLEGFSQFEIGQALMIDENTVAQRMSRARRALKKLMDTADA